MLVITGADVFNVTVLVIVVCFPALSVAVMVIVLIPCTNVSCLLKFPLSSTTTFSAFPLLSFTVTLTGLDVASFVLPVTVIELLFVTSPSAGLVIVNVGGTVSTLNVTDFCAAAFPSKSDASTLIV